MGLDQYAGASPCESVGNGDVEKIQLWHWQKNYELHEAMRAVYLSKGGDDPEFYCCAVEIDLPDLDRVEKVVQDLAANAAHHIDFIVRARQAMAMNCWRGNFILARLRLVKMLTRRQKVPQIDLRYVEGLEQFVQSRLEDAADDLKFIRCARKVISKGYKVSYFAC